MAAKIHNGSSWKFAFDIPIRPKNRPNSPGNVSSAFFHTSDAIAGIKQHLHSNMIFPQPNLQVNQPDGL
jgi:hypothetical protein